MSQYRYQYTGPTGPNNSDDLVSWIIVIIALVAFWPVGLFLLFRKLTGMDKRRYSGSQRTNTTRTTYHYSAPNAAQQSTAQQSAAQSAGAQASATQDAAPQGAVGSKSPSGEYHYRYHYSPQGAKTTVKTTKTVKAGQTTAQKTTQATQTTQTARRAPSNVINGVRLPSGKGLTIAGAIVTGLFGLPLLSEFFDALSWGGLLYELKGLIPLAGLTGVGLVMLLAGIGRRKKGRLFRKYLALIGKRESVSISSLSKAAGRSYKKVCDDLQDMLDAGVLPVGYLDLAADKLVLSAEGIADEPGEEAVQEPAEPPKEDDAILAEIKAVNDQIADPAMSAKIDRIGEITGKILDYQRKNPNKAGQLRNFLSYYLPTTLKILRAYAQLEQQGIEGENISAAKSRIEGMMDKVVEGFEKQLDKLFQNDALDITTDVAVLEKMLDNDGLGSGGMTMGA